MPRTPAVTAVAPGRPATSFPGVSDLLARSSSFEDDFRRAPVAKDGLTPLRRQQSDAQLFSSFVEGAHQRARMGIRGTNGTAPAADRGAVEVAAAGRGGAARAAAGTPAAEPDDGGIPGRQMSMGFSMRIHQVEENLAQIGGEPQDGSTQAAPRGSGLRATT